MSSKIRESWVSMLLVAVSALTVVTCGAMHQETQKPAPATPVGQPPRPLKVTIPVASGTVVASVTVPAVTSPPELPQPQALEELGDSPEGNHLPNLKFLFSELRNLQAQKRDRHVRIAWLGDSHTQVDIWTQPLRMALQSNFGNGGPGFLHVGWTEQRYRHSGVRVKVTGKWVVEPPSLVSFKQFDDGVLGLGGVRLCPQRTDSRAELVIDGSALPGKAAWDMAYRFRRPGGSIKVLSDSKTMLLRSADRIAEDTGGIRHSPWETTGPGGNLDVSGKNGSVELMGVVVESLGPLGVVVDTLGIDGGLVSGALAWDEAAWEHELARRAPELVIVAYGTNESSARRLDLPLHAERIAKLIRRARLASPHADCLVVGPVDREGRYSSVIEQINQTQRSAAEKAGCAFWSAQQAMGGTGSMDKWMHSDPQLARGDGVHLTAAGYQRVGAQLARDVMNAFVKTGEVAK